MGRIHQLDHATSDGIAAGEVVERPSSVVKELVENSIDAGATMITAEIMNGGISLIRITDDGCGMDEEDARLAFSCHATSKLMTLDDLFSLHTMGFRGEALSSISAASKVTLRTREPGSDTGTEVVLEAGNILKVTPAGGPSGTSVQVRDLFFNFPARYKFLKKDATESQYIAQLMERFALIRPDISFRLISQGKEILHSPGNNDPAAALFSVYGKDIVKECIPVEEDFGDLHFSGFIGKPEIARGNRGEQTVYINDRIIRSKTISSAIDEAYKTMLMKGRYAFLVLSVRIPSHLVDVNVHPQKAEVRFWNDGEVFRAVYHVIHNALLSVNHVHTFRGASTEEPAVPHEIPAANPDAGSIAAAAEVSRPSETDRKPGSSAEMLDTIIAGTREKENVLYSDRKKGNAAYPVQTYLSVKEFMPAPPAANPESMAVDSADLSSSNIASSEGYEVSPDETAVKTQETAPATERSRADSSPYGFAIEDLVRARIVGVLFSTYIILELNEGMILLDQHAAHEKILFEKLHAEYLRNKGKPVPSQPMLTPVILSFTPSDMLFVLENNSLLRSTGFAYEPMGDKEIILREVPAVYGKLNPEQAFRETMDYFRRETPKTDEERLLLLATTACKAAVKGHDRLAEIEIRGLIADLIQLKNPYHCPHGRPILIRISQKDLEKEFKRIV